MVFLILYIKKEKIKKNSENNLLLLDCLLQSSTQYFFLSKIFIHLLNVHYTTRNQIRIFLCKSFLINIINLMVNRNQFVYDLVKIFTTKINCTSIVLVVKYITFFICCTFWPLTIIEDVNKRK